MRADVIGAALSLNEETVEAERFRVCAARHGSKGSISRFTIAGELRRLRAKQKRERFGRRNSFYFRGVLARGSEVAGADGDQAAGNRLIGALATATVQMPPEGKWRSENRTQQGPNERQHRHRHQDRSDRYHQRSFDAQALPGEDHVTGAVSQPGSGEGQCADGE